MLWWILPLTALDLATLFLRNDYWIGIWPEAGAAAQVPALLLGIAAAGASAWVSGARARNGLDEQLAAVRLSSARIDAYRLGAVLATFTIPYLCGVAAAWVTTWSANPPGMSLFFKYVFLGGVVILLSCSWGWLIGKILSGRFAAVSAVLSWIIVTMALGSDAGLSFVSGPPSKDIDLAILALRSGVIAALCISLLFLPSRISIHRLPSRLSAITSITAATGVVVAISGPSVITERQIPDNPPCTSGRIEMCYWPEHEKYRSLMNSISARAGELPRELSLPGRIYEYGTIRQQFHVDGAVHIQDGGDFSIMEGSRWSLSKDLSVAITEETFSSCDWDAVRAAEDSSADTIEHWVEIYVAGGGHPDYRLAGVDKGFVTAREESAIVARTKTKADQFAWVQKKVEDFRGLYCE
ncbi:hypothetical protein [Streptomyces sp. WMMC905]|uniref:hypothetical protein n=1 Tax=Streptomyces sp. WMMC905 TaxID=3404123 RepID=UPI003B95202E